MYNMITLSLGNCNLHSNGLIANQAKTEFLVLNQRRKDSHTLDNIVVDDVTVQRTNNTKLLGVMIDDAQDWTVHLSTLRANLNQRLFVIRRIARSIPRNKHAARVWNAATSQIRNASSLGIAKTKINEFCQTLPV